MVPLNNQNIFKKWLLCKRHPLFIYFNKQGFTLIMHDNAPPEGAYLSCPSSPGLVFLSLCVFHRNSLPHFSWDLSCFHLWEVRQPKSGRFMPNLPPLSGVEEEGGERQSPSPSLGHPLYESGSLLMCTCVIVLNPPKVRCDDPSHPQEEKMEA